MMFPILRKFTTEIPDHLITSSGVRPNDDETYQLRKSVEIQEDDEADYYCYVSHRTLTEPVIKQWEELTSETSISLAGQETREPEGPTSVSGVRQVEKHSLYYIYSALNKDVSLPGIYEFTALGLLDDREIDYYNMQEDYWGKGTSLAASEQWFKVNVEILMQRMNHNLHVLQWRHGCEIDESNGTVTFLRGIDQYSYDGSDFLSFDNSNKVWVAPVQAAEETKRKWDNVGILNQYTQGYLEKECGPLCVNPPLEMNKCVLFSNPDVHVFTKKSVYDPKKLILTCLATGFYPKDVELNLRNFSISIPEHLITSSGVRPNDDGTYQLRKSVEISGDDPADYYCYVNHSSFKKPLIKKGGNYNCDW
uniref:Ig-like domain-containing protein n=1 Tax=Astyanax mexicanus TaxID=7994 RepID=A0A3B1J3Q2_ASTMX